MLDAIWVDAARTTERPKFETWRPVLGFEGWYEVSDIGRVRRVGPGRGVRIGHILKTAIRRDREWHYRQMILSVDNARTNGFTHRMVCEAFHGPSPFPGAHVRHLDGDSLNNLADNLAWGSTSENELDKVRHGRHRFGKTHCVNGHEFIPGTYRIRKDGNARVCRACKRESERRRKAA